MVAIKKAPTLTMDGWLARARTERVRRQLRDEAWYEDFQALVRVAARRETLDWDEAVALLHMVYGWMPTMLGTIDPHTPQERDQLVAHLRNVKAGGLLNSAGLAQVRRFANRSIVGTSKLLHVLNPGNYAILDSRVASVFLWRDVAQATYSTVERYEEYLAAVRQWADHPEVRRECAALRALNTALAETSDLRMVELVMFSRL